MKLKKVKIQAFRAYNKVEDGTFDFRFTGEQEADFISLYAPNGFGKTSFYDAVEYAITNNVSRLIRTKLNENASKSQKSASKEEKQLILRNTFATADVETYVEVFTSNINEPTWKRPVKTPKKGSRDFQFSEEKTERKYFREVVLAQEWIDAFLMVDNAEERYSKFVNYFGDKKLDEYYRKIVELLGIKDKQIDLLKKDLKAIQKELDFKGDKEVLKKVNDKIKELVQTGEPLTPITDSFNDSDSLTLANIISESLNTAAFKQKDAEDNMKLLDLLVAGNKQKKSLEGYFKAKEDIIKTGVKEKAHTILINQFLNKQKLENELKNLAGALQQLQNIKNTFEGFMKKIPVFTRTTGELQQLDADLNTERKKKTQNEKKAKDLNIKISENKAALSQLQNQISVIEEEISAMPVLTQKFKKDNLKLKGLKKKLQDKVSALKELTERKDKLEKENTGFRTVILQLEKGKYPANTAALFSVFQTQLNDIKKAGEELTELEKQLGSTNDQIKQQEEFNKDITAFISKGSEIVDKTQISTCPLCTHEHGSFKELSKKITTNNLLPLLMRKFLNTRSLIERNIAKQKALLKQKNDALIKLFKNSISDNDKLITSIEKESGRLNLDKKAIEKEAMTINDLIKSYQSILKGSTLEVYQSTKRAEIEKIKIELDKTAKLISERSKELNVILTELKAIENRLKVYAESVQKTLQDKAYKEMLKFLDANFPKSKEPVKSLQNKVSATAKEITATVKRMNSIRADIENLDKQLKSYNSKGLEKEVAELSKSIELLKSSLEVFEREAANLFKRDISKFTSERLVTAIEKLRTENAKEIEVAELRIKNYTLLNDLRNNVEPFLKYEKAKKLESELKERMEFFENKMKPFLELERKKVTEHLDKQINSFFYEDLINDLYKRIDPHPDYKKIKFICDFTEDKPKLNVCLYQVKFSESPIIPNLYFSTAQLNILSLSIFLAKALNAKDEKGNPVNCIFIDDPIQSMDSINILSTIDLFRSIVTTQGKQIILSTHDENFHNLLKKKMPPEFFKSKFLELETFGKVKQDSPIEA